MDKKTRKALQDLISGFCLLCFGLVMIYLIIPKQIKERSLLGAASGTGVGSKGFPLFSCWIIVIAASLLVASSAFKLVKLLREAKQAESSAVEKKPNKANWINELRAVLLMILCALYMLLFVKIGYIWSTLIVPPLMLLLLGGKTWKAFVSVYGFGVVIYVIFKFVMKVPLP
ncbi:MAG: tripartite tricarboxylate transporter TctB family protein [Spirochaetales bacterium]|nr:tripartite tricarboxylate transporter TctB family protein [Spirochaetales bacterium]